MGSAFKFPVRRFRAYVWTGTMLCWEECIIEAAAAEEDIGILGAGSGGGSGRSSGVGTRKESAESELDELTCCRRRVRDRLRNSFLNDDDVEEAGEEVNLDEEGDKWGGE